MSTTVHTTLDSRLRALYSGDPTEVADPYPLYAELRGSSPVRWFGRSVIVSAYAETRSVYRDNERFLKYRPQGRPFDNALELLSTEEKQMLDEVTAFEWLYMSSMNGDTHKRVRGAVQEASAPGESRRSERWRGDRRTRSSTDSRASPNRT